MNAKPDTFTYTDISQGRTRAYEVTDGDRVIGTVRRTDDDHMWRPVTPSGQALLKARLRSSAAGQLRAAATLARQHAGPQPVYSTDNPTESVGTVRYDAATGRWVGRTLDGTDLLVGYESEDNARAAVVRRAAQIAKPAAGPEAEDCRCAAKLVGRDIEHRSVHDVHDRGTCPCVCHRRDGRDAEQMPEFAQFNIGALADRVTRAVIEHPGPNHPHRIKADVLAEAWTVLTGLPRAQALHVAAELCGRHTIAVTSPF